MPQTLYSLAPTKSAKQASFATNQWMHTSTTATDVGTEEVLTAGMQQWLDVSQTSYAHTVAPRYSLNSKYLLSLALSPARREHARMDLVFNFNGLSHDSWMSPLLLLSLATRLWSQQPASDQDTWPKELKRANSTDTHTSTSFLSSYETTGRPGPHSRKVHQQPHARR